MKSLIFLIGMPGAGKTVWGQRLSQYYQWTHVDMDDVIEKASGKTIIRIFEEDGQAAFRQYEQATLLQIIKTMEGPIIVSCGGGTPLFFDNLEQMKNNGCVVYLKAPIDTLVSHLQNDVKKRPLLVDGNLALKLGGLLAERDGKYQQADYIFEVENLTEATFAEIFAACTNRH